MRKITLSEYNAIPENYRGIWTIERWDLPDWAEIRKRHIGKRTMMVYDKGTCLLVEGIGFEIVDDSGWKKPDEISQYKSELEKLKNENSILKSHLEKSKLDNQSLNEHLKKLDLLNSKIKDLIDKKNILEEENYNLKIYLKDKNLEEDYQNFTRKLEHNFEFER